MEASRCGSASGMITRSAPPGGRRLFRPHPAMLVHRSMSVKNANSSGRRGDPARDDYVAHRDSSSSARVASRSS